VSTIEAVAYAAMAAGLAAPAVRELLLLFRLQLARVVSNTTGASKRPPRAFDAAGAVWKAGRGGEVQR
jgi:hypothetical protein